MDRPTFEGVWAKVERAKEHRDALQRHISDTFAVEDNRPRLGAKFDPESQANMLFVNRIPDLSKEFVRASVLIGDGVHAMRSALDHVAYQLAFRNRFGKTFNDRKPQFPITDSPDGWRKESRDRLGQLAPGDRAIIERYQGYHRIHEELVVGAYFHPLVMLRDLDNADKHRLLNTVMLPEGSWQIGAKIRSAIPILLGNMMSDIVTPVEYRTAKLTFEQGAPIELGTVVARTRIGQPIQREIDNAGDVIPTVAFPEGRPTIEVLDRIAATVIKVIREFEPFP